MTAEITPAVVECPPLANQCADGTPGLAAMLLGLRGPVPERYIKQLPGKNREPVPFIPWQVVPAALDHYTGGNWNTAITRAEIIGGDAVVGVRLTIWDADGRSSSRESLAAVKVDGPAAATAPPLEVAERSALKRAAGLFGFGNDLRNGGK